MVYVKSNLQSSSPYRAQDLTGQCTRNGEPAPCGVYFPVTDYLGKVVVLLDSNGKVAGTGEYEPFGHVNRVTYLGETPHPYPASVGRVVGYLKHPVLSGTTSILRARYPLVRTDATAYAQLTDRDTNTALLGFYIPAGQTQQQPNRPVGGTGARAQVSDWVQVPSNGSVRARFWAGSASTHPGVSIDSFEYRRFQTGAQPVWLPLRFPGQYYDAETDLFQNFNRFYDAQTGRY